MLGRLTLKPKEVPLRMLLCVGACNKYFIPPLNHKTKDVNIEEGNLDYYSKPTAQQHTQKKILWHFRVHFFEQYQAWNFEFFRPRLVCRPLPRHGGQVHFFSSYGRTEVYVSQFACTFYFVTINFENGPKNTFFSINKYLITFTWKLVGEIRSLLFVQKICSI